MQEKRRIFLKKSLQTGAVVVGAAVVGVNAKPSGKEGNGVVSGKSRKREILYKETKAWELYYKRSY